MSLNNADYSTIRDYEIHELPCGCSQVVLKDADCSKCKKKMREGTTIHPLELGLQRCSDCFVEALKIEL